MLLDVYSISDKAAGQYGNPMCFSSDAEAIRMFFILMTDPNGRYHQFIEDFSLVHIATFDTKTGQIAYDVNQRLVADHNVVVAMLDKNKKSVTM